jgi:hypothetical protein
MENITSDSEDGDVRYVEMIEVFSTYNPGDIAFIKSVLDGEDIHYFLSGRKLRDAGCRGSLCPPADSARSSSARQRNPAGGGIPEMIGNGRDGFL